jgi:isopentenyl-diphosphate delta-isomerase type 1
MPEFPSDTEPLDILDAEGRLLGVVKPRSEAHRRGLWHRTVHVWIVNGKNRLLLQRRALTKESFPGLWDISAAGHITAGDSSIAGALRELHEELGIAADSRSLELLFKVKNSYEDFARPFIDREFSDVYLFRTNVDKEGMKVESTEIDEVRYFDVEELKREMKLRPEAFVPHAGEYKKLFERIAED